MKTSNARSTGQIVEQRTAKVRTFMQEQGLDGILLRKRRSFAWLTGGRDNHIVNTSEEGVADLLLLNDRLYCIASKMENARIAEEELDGVACDWVTPEWHEGHDAAIARLTEGLKIGTDVLPAKVGGLLDGVHLERPLAELSYTLDDREIDAYRELAKQAARAVESTCREIVPGMTEHQIHAHLAAKVIAQGINPHVILVATDERIFRYRHPIPTAKPLERYAMVVLCAEWGGLIANVTRFVHFGPLSDELHTNKRKLAEIDLAFNLSTRPGALIQDVLQQGLDAYQSVGHAEDWKYLHQGGPTGYSTREFLATPGCEGVVRLHQAFAWNPAIRGIKSEDTILVLEEHNEFLTHTGEWEYIIMEKNNKTYHRPDILIRSLE
jgi:Xaa-Pro dipeptidase